MKHVAVRSILIASLSLSSFAAFAHEPSQPEHQHQHKHQHQHQPPTSPERPKDAPPGIGHHDHTPLHGGIVMMSGDDHVELLAAPGGVYRLWYTDGWRRPLNGDVKATIVVKTSHGQETLVMRPTGSKDGELRAQGKVLGDVARTVFLDGFARGYPVKTQFDVRSPSPVAPKVPSGKVPSGKVPSGKVPSGKVPSGKVSSGR